MKMLHQFIRRYDAATVFVYAATIVVIVELSLMRILVPVQATAGDLEYQTLMEQVCVESNLIESAKCVEGWETQSKQFSQRLSETPARFQRNLESMYVFGVQAKDQSEFKDTVQSRMQFIEAANYAADNLLLQSIMTGRTILANINGSIYREGDTISMRGGEIVLSIIELGSTYAIVQLAEHDYNGDTTRTLYLENSSKSANGEKVQ